MRHVKENIDIKGPYFSLICHEFRDGSELFRLEEIQLLSEVTAHSAQLPLRCADVTRVAVSVKGTATVCGDIDKIESIGCFHVVTLPRTRSVGFAAILAVGDVSSLRRGQDDLNVTAEQAHVGQFGFLSGTVDNVTVADAGRMSA